MATADLGGDGLRMRPPPGGDVAGVDTGLRTTRTATAWGSTGEALNGQWKDAGPFTGAAAGSWGGALIDEARNVAATADTHSRERVGGRQSRLARSGHGGAVRRQRGGGVCLDGGRGGLRENPGGGARGWGVRAEGGAGGTARGGRQPGPWIVGAGKR